MGTTLATNPAVVILYNPHTTDLTVDVYHSSLARLATPNLSLIQSESGCCRGADRRFVGPENLPASRLARYPDNFLWRPLPAGAELKRNNGKVIPDAILTILPG